MKIRFIVMSVIVVCFSLFSCSFSEKLHETDSSATMINDALSPSELLSRSEELDGKTIVVKGVLRYGPEMSGIWNSADDIEFKYSRTKCVTVYDPSHKIEKFGLVPAQITGIYQIDRGRLIILGACGSETIVITKIKLLGDIQPGDWEL